MKQKLLNYLCDPKTKKDLYLENPVYGENGDIVSGVLKSASGAKYPIINGIPRFVFDDSKKKTVDSFGK